MKPSKISDLVEKINKGISNSDFPNVPKIEYDLLLQHIRELYAEIDALKDEKSNHLKEGTGNKDRERREHIQPESLLIKTTMHSNQNLLLNDIHPQEMGEIKKVKQEEKTGTKPEPKRESTTKSSSINESIKFSETLNEKLKSSSGKEVHKKLAIKPLKDLIDLNKRFVLLNELFKGNDEAFSTAISHIDALSDYSAAESFIQSQLVSNYYWDESSQSARLFRKLVRVKFGME